MKRLGIIALAFALVLGMSQCKKENTTASNDEGAKVPITLNVGGASTGSATGGSRVAVDTETGVVTFENGDLLYVASNGLYIGSLTYNGTNFAGEVTEPTEGQKLQFYFLGNVTPAETMTEGTTTGCSVVISDQTEHLPVISYAPSRENYQVGLTAYNATLLNKCALVKFDVTTASEAATCILGMNNKVTVDFADNSFAYSQDDEGMITLPAGSGEKWAILLPQEEVTEAEAQASDGSYTGTCGTIPDIAENDYLTEGIAVTIETATGPVGIINGAFTINANGDQVYFSQGNLQYNKTTNEWSFKEHQYDIVETNSQNVGWNYANQNIVSLFGWGTSGYNHGAVCYQPWSTNGNYYNYCAYGNWQNNLYDGDGQADWGYNVISNGGNTENSGWRTLTQPEWDYVFNTRSTTGGIRWAQGTVNGVNGTILLPDNWAASIYALNNTNGGNYSCNIITAEDWANVLEANGAVFLPAAGHRSGTLADDVGSSGCYWSASYCDIDSDFAYCVSFGSGYLYANYDDWSSSDDRQKGRSVRLVRTVQ